MVWPSMIEALLEQISVNEAGYPGIKATTNAKVGDVKFGGLKLVYAERLDQQNPSAALQWHSMNIMQIGKEFRYWNG